MHLIVGILGYCLVGLATGALIWAITELERTADLTRHWEPGTKPHTWRL